MQAEPNLRGILELLVTEVPENVALAEALALSVGRTIKTVIRDFGLNEFDIYDVKDFPNTEFDFKYRKRKYKEVGYLKPLTIFKDLIILRLSCTGIRDISLIGAFPKLRVLDLSVNEITDICPIAQLKNLEHLRLCRNYIRSVAPLAGLSKLHTIYIQQGCKPKDLHALAHLKADIHANVWC